MIERVPGCPHAASLISAPVAVPLSESPLNNDNGDDDDDEEDDEEEEEDFDEDDELCTPPSSEFKTTVDIGYNISVGRFLLTN